MQAPPFKLQRPAEILLVEDNEDDVVLTRKGFELSGLPVVLHRVEHGKVCMEFLRKSGPYQNAPTPDLILLDLNMPVMDGRAVLAEIVQDEQLRQLPVVILTTSEAEADVLAMYKLRCSSYIAKPIDFLRFRKVVEDLGHYWFKVATLPTQ